MAKDLKTLALARLSGFRQRGAAGAFGRGLVSVAGSAQW